IRHGPQRFRRLHPLSHIREGLFRPLSIGGEGHIGVHGKKTVFLLLRLKICAAAAGKCRKDGEQPGCCPPCPRRPPFSISVFHSCHIRSVTPDHLRFGNFSPFLCPENDSRKQTDPFPFSSPHTT